MENWSLREAVMNLLYLRELYQRIYLSTIGRSRGKVVIVKEDDERSRLLLGYLEVILKKVMTLSKSTSTGYMYLVQATVNSYVSI